MHDTGEVRNISFTKLKALLSFQLDAMVRARNAYQNWHAAVHGDVTQLLPLRQENLKAFCADLAKAGYAPNTIIQLYLAGLCTWVSCFPFLAFSKHVFFTLLVSPSIDMSTKYIKNYNSIVQWNPYCIIWNSFKHKLIVATQINNNIYFHFSKWPTICHRQDGSFLPWPWQWRPIWEGSWALVLTWRRRPCSRRMSNTWSTPAGLTRPSSYSVSKISFPIIFE